MEDVQSHRASEEFSHRLDFRTNIELRYLF
jgi:hypothetical protein